MKLHFHPASTASRSVLHFFAEADVSYDAHVVDLMSGEQQSPEYSAINPNQLVPTLQDGDFTLTESSAICCYVANKIDSPLYPKDHHKRARVDEAIHWVNCNFQREWNYHLIYSQLFPHHKRPSDAAQAGTIEWGKEKSLHYLKLMDSWLLSRGQYVAGDDFSIADCIAAANLTLGEAIRADFSSFASVTSYLKRVKERPAYQKVNEAFDGFVKQLADKPFVTIP